MSSSRTHRTRPLLQQTGMPRQLCPTADAQLHAAANAAATSCDHHGGIHFELGIDPEARLLLTLHKLHHVGIADLLAWYDECQQCSGNQRPSTAESISTALIKCTLPYGQQVSTQRQTNQQMTCKLQSKVWLHTRQLGQNDQPHWGQTPFFQPRNIQTSESQSPSHPVTGRCFQQGILQSCKYTDVVLAPISLC